MYMKYFSLREMRETKPIFFENSPGPERYNVRKNHLIVTNLQNNKITVWQFHYNGAMYVLTPVWYAPPHMTTQQAIYKTERMIEDGRWPAHPHGGYDHTYDKYEVT